MSPTHGSCADFQLGLWITENIDTNINTDKLIQKNRKKIGYADVKGPQH